LHYTVSIGKANPAQAWTGPEGTRSLKLAEFIEKWHMKVAKLSAVSNGRLYFAFTHHKTNTEIAKELNITPVLDKIQEYTRNWIHHVNRMAHNRVPRIMKNYTPKGRRNQGRPLKRLLDKCDRNGSTSGPTP
jgi:hypothetical protein